jgi:hypothetical protein
MWIPHCPWRSSSATCRHDTPSEHGTTRPRQLASSHIGARTIRASVARCCRSFKRARLTAPRNCQNNAPCSRAIAIASERRCSAVEKDHPSSNRWIDNSAFMRRSSGTCQRTPSCFHRASGLSITVEASTKRPIDVNASAIAHHVQRIGRGGSHSNGTPPCSGPLWVSSRHSNAVVPPLHRPCRLRRHKPRQIPRQARSWDTPLPAFGHLPPRGGKGR